jgi:hypothetical protein
VNDSHAFVTRYVTGESQHPVPALPDPSRPALYRDRGDFTSIRPVGNARAARLGWMGESQ